MSNNTTSTLPYSEIRLLYEVGAEPIIVCVTGGAVWVLMTFFLYRAQLQFKKRRRGLAKFHEQEYDEDEETSATTKYMVSFFTSGPHAGFKGPPTGQVVAHLCGSTFPGKFHVLRASKPALDSELLSPLACEKFLVTEDVRLGRMIGIVLRTEVEGTQPSWYCTTAIVRDVKTNEAWLFRINREISSPPRLFEPATQEELCAFKFSFYRRLRREVRNGQFGYFSFLFRSKLSVFTYPQRCVTSIGLYLLFSVTCFLFLDYVFAPGHSTGDPTRYGLGVHTWLNPTPIRPKPGNPSILVLYGESAASYWILHALIPALIAASITTLLGFFMISSFRQASKFERQFDEMDYVIGTALLEESRHKEGIKIKKQAIMPQFREPTEKSSFTAQIETSIGPSEDSGSIVGSIGNIYYPVGDEPPDRIPTKARRATAEERSLYRLLGLLRGATKKTLVLMKLRDRTSLEREIQPEPVPVSVSVPGSPGSDLSLPMLIPGSNLSLLVYPSRSVLFEPSEKVEYLAPELSPYHERELMRQLFLGPDDRTGNFRRTSGSMGNWRLNSRNFMTFNVVEKGKTKAKKYDLAYMKPVRKWYKPILAWVLVIVAITLSVSFIIVISVVGKFHRSVDEEQFVQTFLATLAIGVLVGTVILEPFKIFLIGLWQALRDKKIYKRIEDSTEKLNSA